MGHTAAMQPGNKKEHLSNRANAGHCSSAVHALSLVGLIPYCKRNRHHHLSAFATTLQLFAFVQIVASSWFFIIPLVNVQELQLAKSRISHPSTRRPTLFPLPFPRNDWTGFPKNHRSSTLVTTDVSPASVRTS